MVTHDASARAPGRSGLAYWVCQLIGWGTYVFVTIYQITHLVPTIAGARPFVEPMISAGLGITLTHVLRRIAKARGWVRLGPRPFASRLVAVIAIVVVLHVGALSVVEMGFYGDRPASPVVVIVFAMMRWSMVFFIWLAIYFGVAVFRERQRAEVEQLELERALHAAELRALKSQLNPHFLFNALNSVRALIHEDPGLAETAVTRLARTLRYALGAGKDDTVPFERELRVVDDYVELESLRLAERLRVERSISDDAGAAHVPVMLLQILVENAIRHGIAHLPDGGTLRISAKRSERALVVRVDNPRPPFTCPTLDTSNRVGLANANERLRLLFGGNASLELDLSHPDRATATARIPQTA